MIWFPHVGHCPSWAAIASVASSRDEQYPQLNPYRFPPDRGMLGRKLEIGGGGGGGGGMLGPPTPAPTATASAAGTRSVAWQEGHLTSCPVCDSSAHRGDWQVWHGKTFMRYRTMVVGRGREGKI